MVAIGEAVRRMEAAGYRVATDGGKLVVTGGKPLNEGQRDWLTRHKPALLAHLAALADPNVAMMLELFDAEVVAVHLVEREHSGVVPDADTTPPVFTRGEPCG